LRTLVIYDITDNDKRLWVSELLLDIGLERIQYSCFLGLLDGAARSSLVQRVKGVVEQETDSVYVVPLCERCLGQMVRVPRGGRGVEEEEVVVL
jgi:CRISPR-associated protein Cas2